MVDINKVRNRTEDPEEECECRFTVNEDGQPIVFCADSRSQEMAVRSMQHRDVLVRVNPVPMEVDQEDDDADQVPDELELGVAEDGEVEDDFDEEED